MSAQNLKKFILLGSLYLSQFMPFWFLSQGLPVIFREKGMSLEAIGFLPVLLLPIAFKFLWAPLIDFYGFTRWGHYRFWIFCFQLSVVTFTVVCSFLSVETHLVWLLVGMTAIAIASSSQDIATDALALGLLKPKERGAGNAVQGIGGSIGRAIGGGGMLILLSRWGWTASLLTLALMMVVALIPLFFHRETVPSRSRRSHPKTPILSRAIAHIKTLTDSCQRPGIRSWLGVLALATVGYNLAATMFRPLLVDIGLSLEDIGWLMGIFGMIMTVLGSLAAGFSIPKLGRKRSLLLSLTLTAIAILTQLLPTFGLTQLPVLYAIVSLSFFSIGIMGTTSFTIMMDKSRQEMAGTDYTIQTSVIPLCSIISAALSGLLAGAIGYRGVFLLGAGLTIACIVLAIEYLKIFEVDRSILDKRDRVSEY